MFKRARRSVMFADPPPSPKPRSKFEPLQTLVVATGIWHDVNGEGDTIADVPIPTNIHLDLLRAGKIPDPHLEMNEREVQWVHSRSWKLSTEFYLTVPGFALHQHADLVFEGLDTFATIFLNGKEILKSDNMFQTYRVDITPHVVFMGKQNVLEMVFDSAMARGEELVAKHGERTCVNGHNSRTYVRKAQYQYGWDGGPSLVTCGPWKPIYIDIYNARISHVDCIPLLSPDLRHAVLEIRAKVDAADELNGDLTVSVVIVSPAGVEFISTLGAGTKVSDFRSVRISIPYPELWYPKSHGAQNIYNIDFELKDSCSGKVLHTISQRFGLRHVEIVQNSHPEISVRSVSGESTFYIKINNTPIFCAGSNWISADSFQPRITRETLRAWIADLVGDRGNQSMIRVWGGGVYESEEFYDICDEAGILVWQDIALASADYPAHLDTFASSISMEVKQNLERLRWHPSLVVVAGNSDVHSIPDDKVIVNEKDGQVPSLSEEASSSRYLNENLFPDILKDTCSSSIKVPPYGCVSAGLVYWPGNSFGGKDNTYRTVGGIHQWNEYRSVQELRQECLGLGGRFIRQFGIIAHPNVMTIESGFLNPTHSLSESQSPKDYHLQSEISRQTKTRSVEKETTPYIFENFQPRTGSVAEIVYLTQLAQSESLYIAYSICRLKWHTPQHRDCGGALLWHMNDLWPTTSCSIVDCYKRPKMAFYSTARALKPISLITSRVTEDMPKRNIQMEEAVGGHEISEKDVPAAANQSVPGSIFRKTTIQVVLSSILPKTTDDLHIEVRYVCMSTGESEVVYTAPAVSIEGNRSIEIYGAEVPAESSTVVHSVLQKSSPSGVVLARDTSWPRLIKRVGMVSSESGLNVEVSPRDVESDEAEIKITAEKPIKGLLFEERDGEIWTDNAVDVVPGDLYKILVRGINSKDKWNPKSWKSYGSC